MKYTPVNDDHPQAMRLQSIGLVQGTPASQIKENDLLMWNFGGVSRVTKIIKETVKTLVIEEIPVKNEFNNQQKAYKRRLFKNRLVCILK